MDMPANAKLQTISGKKYVFIDTPYWNAEKHRGEHKRRYIGKIVEGQFVPNGKYLLSLEKSGTIKPGPIPATECKRQFYGATYLLDQIGDKLGIVDDLKASFPIGISSSCLLPISLSWRKACLLTVSVSGR